MRQLTYVVAVDDAGTFTHAARNYHVAQSALSKQIGALETELGARLFHRTTRTVTLTDAGATFLPAARQILADAEAARARVLDVTGLRSGLLRIGGTQTATRIIDLPAVLGRFHRQHPLVEITVVAGPRAELVDGVMSGHLDIALAGTFDDDTPDAVAAHRIKRAKEPLVAVVAPRHPLARETQVHLTELAAHGPFIDFRRGTDIHDRLDTAFAELDVARTIAFELGQMSDMVRFAVNGLGTAIVPKIFTAGLTPDIAAVLPLADPGLALTINAYTQAHNRGHTTDAALRLLIPPGHTRPLT